MSDHIPFELQVEIMRRLPVKSLIQYRSVSKPWKSVIDSSDFIVDYTRHARHHHLLIKYQNPPSEGETYVSIVDDDTFPQNKYHLTVPPSVKLLRHAIIVDTSCGLVFVFGYYRNPGDFEFCSGTAMAVVWNPSIRKSVAIDVPDFPWASTIGFGVCPATSDPKIVKITDTRERHVTYSSTRWLVEVFSLSSGVWRRLPNNDLSDDLVKFKSIPDPVTIDGFIYWFGVKNINNTSDTEFYLLISFDLSSEEFREIHLPDDLTCLCPNYLYLFKRSDSLAVLKHIEGVYEVWVMENGASNSFTNLFTISIPNVISLPLEFRRNGEVVMAIGNDDNYSGSVSVALVVYEPFFEQINHLGFKALSFLLFGQSYTESLLLIDQ